MRSASLIAATLGDSSPRFESWHVVGQRLGTRIGAAHDGRQKFYALESSLGLYGSLALPSLACARSKIQQHLNRRGSFPQRLNFFAESTVMNGFEVRYQGPKVLPGLK